METRESIGSAIWKALGQSLADKIIALAVFATSVLTGVTSQRVDEGTLKTLLLFISVAFFVAFFVFLYINQKFTELNNTASRSIDNLSWAIKKLQEGDREWRACYSNLNRDLSSSINESRAEFIKYLEVVGLMHRYLVSNRIAESVSYMGRTDLIIDALAEERKGLEQQFSQSNTSITPERIRYMFNPFYGQIGANS